MNPPAAAQLPVLGRGALVTIYAYLAMGNDIPDFLWWPAWILGPILVLIGGNSIFRGLRGK